MDLADRQHQTSKPELDCASIISHFGGTTQLYRLLTEHGSPITTKAIEKWRSRKNIPTAQLVTLADIAKQRGMRFDIYDFIVKKGDEL